MLSSKRSKEHEIVSEFTDMRDRIASELNRSDLTTEIDRQINNAVRHYESTRMRWNEVRDWNVGTTSAGARYYSLTTDFLSMDTLKVIRNGSYVSLAEKPFRWIDERDTSDAPTQGVPTYYTIYADLLRVYPTADSSMTMLGSYIKRASTTTLTASSSTTWLHFRGGEELIRARAIAGVRVDRLRQRDAIAEMAGLVARREPFMAIKEQIAHGALIDERNDALATGLVTPVHI
jgi:hypothetical protein